MRLMFALVLGVAVAPSRSELSSQDIQKMEEYKVVPEVIPEPPKHKLTVKYGDLTVDMGNELTPTQVKDKPTTLTWPTEEGALYTLIMNDRDIPPHIPAKEVQHWLVVNIPGTDIAKGVTLFDYVGSGPPKDSGLHRYVFLVYKQPNGILDPTTYKTIKDETVESRRQYILKDLLKQLNLQELHAGNFYRAQYDENVPKFHEERRKKYQK